MKTAAISFLVGSTLMLFAPQALAGYPTSPYCLIDRDGVRSCGFRNLQECLEVRIGVDMCVVNPYYNAPPPRSRRAR